MKRESEGRKTAMEQESVQTFPQEVLQRFQEAFCRVNHIYMVFVQRGMENITRFTGTGEEQEFIDEHFPAVLQRELLANFSDGDGEDVIALTPEEDYLLFRGVAVRGADQQVTGVWLVMGIDEEELPSNTFYSKNLYLTTREQFEYAIGLLELTMKTYFSKQVREVQLMEEVGKLEENRQTIEARLERSEVMTEILKSMEMDQPFDQIAEKILSEVGCHMHLSNCHMLRLRAGEEEEALEVICEWSDLPEHSFFHAYDEETKDQVPFLTGRPYTISSDAMMPTEFQEYFEEHHMTAGVFLPVEIHGRQEMYLSFVQMQEERKWSGEDLKFLSDVKRILQAVLMGRITRNSLASSYTALEEILEHIGCGVCVNDKDNRVMLFSNRMFKNLKITHGDRERLQWDLMNAGEDTRRFQEYQTKESDLSFEISFADVVWVDGRKAQLATLYDITQLKQYQIKIERQANEDHLTGLWNRMRFMGDLEKMIHASVRAADPSALLLINLRNFSQINDEMGHQMGNALLQHVAKALNHMEGASGHCYRLDGDEFAILVTNRHYDRLPKLVSAIGNRFDHPWQIGGQVCTCHMNMGVIRIPKDGVTVDTVMKRIDIALHRARKLGENRVVYYEDRQRGRSKESIEMEQYLLLAANQRQTEFELYYQPIFTLPSMPGEDIDTGFDEGPPVSQEAECVGAEALIRWRSSTYDVMNPGEFLPMAEYLGLMPGIGRHVLVEACKRCKYWNDFGRPEFHVTVNMSLSQLLYKDTPEYIRAALEKTELEPSHLRIDVVEYDNVREMEHLAQVLRVIRQLGVKIALDDFGMEGTSFHAMRIFSADMIKFSESCIAELGTDPFMKQYVEAAVGLADLLHIQTLAKGVEWQKQVLALQKMHLTMAQGYVFDKPMSSEDFEKKYIF